MSFPVFLIILPYYHPYWQAHTSFLPIPLLIMIDFFRVKRYNYIVCYAVQEITEK